MVGARGGFATDAVRPRRPCRDRHRCRRGNWRVALVARRSGVRRDSCRTGFCHGGVARRAWPTPAAAVLFLSRGRGRGLRGPRRGCAGRGAWPARGHDRRCRDRPGDGVGAGAAAQLPDSETGFRVGGRVSGRRGLRRRVDWCGRTRMLPHRALLRAPVVALPRDGRRSVGPASFLESGADHSYPRCVHRGLAVARARAHRVRSVRTFPGTLGGGDVVVCRPARGGKP